MTDFEILAEQSGVTEDGDWLQVVYQIEGETHTLSFHGDAWGSAQEHRQSYFAAMFEVFDMPLEERLAPFGPEWEREQREG